jgi:Zn-finger protein
MYSYRFFTNRDCEFFPCHKNVNEEEFNCIFCYCPLYAFDDCGGCYTKMEKNVKDCSACTLPHKRENYEKIIRKLTLYD